MPAVGSSPRRFSLLLLPEQRGHSKIDSPSFKSTRSSSAIVEVFSASANPSLIYFITTSEAIHLPIPASTLWPSRWQFCKSGCSLPFFVRLLTGVATFLGAWQVLIVTVQQ